MHARRWHSVVAGLVLVRRAPALASSGSAAKSRAQSAIQSAKASKGNVQKAASRARRQRLTPAQRIAAGDILFRSKDYARAIDVFERWWSSTARARRRRFQRRCAVFLLGESYTKTKQLLSAKWQYNEIRRQRLPEPVLRYAGRALSRLIDIAIKTENYPSLDEIYAKLGSLPASDASGSLPYARAKAQFARKDYDAAKGTANGVSTASPYGMQAQYLLGVILVKQATPAPPPDEAPAAEEEKKPDQPTIVSGKEPEVKVPKDRYAAAIEQFRRVTRMKADTDRTSGT